MTPLETVTRWYDTREPELFAEDIRFNVCSTFPCSGAYRGRNAVYEDFFANLLPRLAAFDVARDREFEHDGQVYVIGRYVGRVANDAPEFHAPFTHVWTVEGDEITQVDQHAETGVIDRAFAAAA